MTALSTITFNILDIRETASLFGFTLEWQWFALASFILFLVFVGWWVGGLESYKHQMEHSNPKLLFKKAGEWQFYTEGRAVYHALQIWFVNNPQVASDNSVAKDVGAVITFYDRSMKNRLEIYGCFTEAEVPDYATIAPAQRLKDKIEVWSPNAIPQKLLIALKYPDDNSAYGFAKSNFIVAQDGREAAKEIKKGEHYMQVSFMGTGVRQAFWFILNNPGEGGVLSLAGPIKKPDLCKEGFQTE